VGVRSGHSTAQQKWQPNCVQLFDKLSTTKCCAFSWCS